MRDVVEAKDLSCFYGPVMGLNRVNFAIRGGITGLVGPNGAGKSTLIKMITGQLKPSAGSLTVLQQNPMNNVDLLGRIGYCPEHEQLHRNATPMVLLRSLGTLSGIPWSNLKEKSEDVLQRVRLSPKVWNTRIGDFSKGMKQRVKLAQALMHNPELLILDEPMNGLDPMGRNDISGILRSLSENGIHIIISSHILNELESLCENFLLLKWGRVVASGNRKEIAAEVDQRSDQVRIKVDKPSQLVEHLLNRNLLKGYLIQEDELIVWLREPEGFYKKWPMYLNRNDVKIYEVIDENSSLEKVFTKV
ncbi:ABC transporter ATP-binding protein [Puniceicoccaceae bacterium K14]|nr:ABC transporter ATP-binding protein [Puniceicoccaceae bacterium K14]